MKKHNLITLLSLSVVFVLVFASCKDKCEAGLGGDITLAVFPQHHDVPIYSQDTYPDSVFIKFNTQDFPGESPADYDLVMKGETGEDHIHITGLKCGDYFIFMTGLDTNINERVKGGIPYSLEEGSGEVDLVVPVTED